MKTEMMFTTGVSLGTMQDLEVMLVGSANIDLVIRTPRFPAPGETLQGSDFQTFAGGKGANQAVAIGKIGGNCGLIAKVGSDGFGKQLIESLRTNNIHINNVLQVSTESTGVAVITVDAQGQNTILVAQGTNGLLAPEEVRQGLSHASFKVLLVQLEIPMEAVMEASKFASGRIFILNPAPAQELSDELLSRVDYLTPNETEAHLLTGILPVDSKSCDQAAAVILAKGVKNVLFTLGSMGSYLANASGGRLFPAIRVTPIDTTAAGDAFNGAFAHFLASGETVDRSIHLANIAGALCTTKPGAQASMPSLAEILLHDQQEF